MAKQTSGQASQSQKNASAKMKKLGERLTKMQQEMEQEDEGEDMEAIRQGACSNLWSEGDSHEVGRGRAVQT